MEICIPAKSIGYGVTKKHIHKKQNPYQKKKHKTMGFCACRVSKKSPPCRQSLISFKTLTSRQKYKAEVPSAKSLETSAFSSSEVNSDCGFQLGNSLFPNPFRVLEKIYTFVFLQFERRKPWASSVMSIKFFIFRAVFDASASVFLLSSGAFVVSQIIADLPCLCEPLP